MSSPLSPKAQAAVARIVERFQAGNLSPVRAVARLRGALKGGQHADRQTGAEFVACVTNIRGVCGC